MNHIKSRVTSHEEENRKEAICDCGSPMERKVLFREITGMILNNWNRDTCLIFFEKLFFNNCICIRYTTFMCVCVCV